MPAAKIHAKRGPKTALDDDALLALIRADLAASPFTGEGHRKVHARLHFLAGHKVGRNRVLRLMRLMRAHNLLSPHRTAFAPAKAHDGRIITDAPNLRWATDGTKIWTVEDGWVWLFDPFGRLRAEWLLAAVATFVHQYNHHWRLEKLRYQSPIEARLAFHSAMPLAA